MTAPPRTLILLATTYFGRPPRIDEERPEFELTTDLARQPQADAVVFHIPDTRRWPSIPRYPRNLLVAWSLESSVNYPALADPFLMRAFDLRMTYQRDADVWLPYFPPPDLIEAARRQPLPPRTEAAPVVHFQSSGVDRCGRTAFAAELMRHIAVDSYGSDLRNRVLDGPDLGRMTKLAVVSRYSFCLALENSIAPDYVTEKIFDAFLAGSVPVYRGAPNVAEFTPGPHSYVDANDFAGPAELAAYLKHLAADEAAYRAYFAWREDPDPRFLDAVARAAEPRYARLARRVAALQEQKSRPPEGERPVYPFSRARRFGWALSRLVSR
jgi:hypothetical protein